MEYILLLIIAAAIGGGIGFGIGGLGDKKNEGVGAVLGACLGPVGWIIVALLPANAGDGTKEEKTQAPDRDARIAKLEAELAALKQAPKPSNKVMTRKDLSDDGSIPTYKLD